jgi:alpha-N-arabinofuranosidase
MDRARGHRVAVPVVVVSLILALGLALAASATASRAPRAGRPPVLQPVLRYAPAVRRTLLTVLAVHPPTPTPTPPTVTTTTPTTTTTPAPPPATSIAVDTTHPGSAISPGLFGSDLLAPFGGMGSFDGTTGFWPSFVAQLTSEVGAGSLRFPGGITGQSYNWMGAVGPESSRTDNPVGPDGRPSPSTVGPDEFGELLDLTGAQGVYDVDFASGTAAEAADLVQYMTGAPGSSTWANQRVAHGHTAPYDVPYWEVGNEEETPQYWRAGSIVQVRSVPGVDCPSDATGLYICGGTTSFSGQPVVGDGDGDRSPASSVSTGTPNQSFQVAYPPVAQGSMFSVQVNGVSWTDDTLNRTTGTITFGGMTPPTGPVTATYTSGPHDGFDQYYAAMKAANPAIQVCATDTGTSFIDDAGTSLPYDCLQDHPYVGTGAISASLPLDEYEADVMAVADAQLTNVQSFQAQVDQAAGRHVPLVLTEYGQLIDSTPDPLQAPYYLGSLDEALVNASQLADWIQLGIPVADRQLLDAELPAAPAVTAGLPGAAPFATTGAITTPGPQTVVQPTGEYLALMEPLAGGSLLPATVTGNPVLATSNPTPTGDLAVVSAATASGAQLVVINRSPTADVPAAVAFAGVSGGGTATVTTLDGPSPLSENSVQAPDTVSASTSAATVTGGAATITFPAHSVSLVTLPGA